jgi:hypothetical protein
MRIKSRAAQAQGVENITAKPNPKNDVLVTANPTLFTLTELTDIQTLSSNNQ